MKLGSKIADWLDDRTGFRAARHHLLDEPIPAGTGWWFVTGSVVMFLLTIQIATGIALAMYYVPSPADAYDSVRYITDRLTFGHVLRGLHHFGASFIVIASVVHMLRTVVYASYKKPREMNWIIGVVLLLIILGFALTGYLLPWDQRAYWATTVTISIAQNAPFGSFVAGLMRGGTALGALTLLRWYAAHVFLLPACLIGFTVAHLYLMRRHGISGPMRKVDGPAHPFYPFHAVKDTVVVSAVFALLLTLAITWRTPIESVADPAGAGYVPRPEWYFLSLFQLLKYFPGPLEPVATMVVPGLAFGLLFLLPFLDRGTARHPRHRPAVMAGFAFAGAAVVLLTYLGYRDAPNNADPAEWSLMPIAGRTLAEKGTCATCHREGGAASPVSSMKAKREPEWLLSHVKDPEVIAPGIRPAPRGGLNAGEALAIAAYARKVTIGAPLPVVSAETAALADLFSGSCAGCHALDADGATSGPDLSHVGAKRDAKWLARWIADPSEVDPKSTMPAFGAILDDDKLDLIVKYLAARH